VALRNTGAAPALRRPLMYAATMAIAIGTV
jgi:hypothetical protein